MSKYLPTQRFSFLSYADSTDKNTFGVIRFSGTEGISQPYEFDITLVSDNQEIDLEAVLANPARFTILREEDEGGNVDFNGMIAAFEQLHKFGEYIFYRARLVPRLWWLGISHHNQVCLNKSVPEIIKLTLQDAGLTSLDFDFKLQSQFSPLEYVCQYNESHLNFISRWLEREGIYYYFDQSGDYEKVIFTDTLIAHTDHPINGDVYYVPPSGLIEDEKMEMIDSFICRLRQLPQKVFFKDYNYERPTLGISGTADVDLQGRGTDYIYGDHFKTSEEGTRLATIRAESLNCRKQEFVGESTIPFLEPGYTFTLHGHYRENFNQRYLVETVSHEGDQTGYLIPEISEGLSATKNTIFYRNSFTVIAASVQYRPERKAIKPRIAGTIHAVIDAAGSGEYAELDELGRYKVKLPFDENSEHEPGKASARLRMMQPYASSSGGMQFPLTKGTEVLLTFIDGDPDRPVIAGAVANPQTPSPVTGKNQTESVIKTGGNNKIRIEDKKGSERVIMESPKANSWIRIGTPNDPAPADTNPVIDQDLGDGIKISTAGDIVIEETTDGNKIEIKNKSGESVILLNKIDGSDTYGIYLYSKENILIKSDKKVTEESGEKEETSMGPWYNFTLGEWKCFKAGNSTEISASLSEKISLSGSLEVSAGIGAKLNLLDTGIDINLGVGPEKKEVNLRDGYEVAKNSGKIQNSAKNVSGKIMELCVNAKEIFAHGTSEYAQKDVKCASLNIDAGKITLKIGTVTAQSGALSLNGGIVKIG